jgi:hypothetical protein
VLQYFISYSNYCNRDPFMHYRIRANVYVVLGRGVVGSCFGVRLFVRIFLGGGGVHTLVKKGNRASPSGKTNRTAPQKDKQRNNFSL